MCFDKGTHFTDKCIYNFFSFELLFGSNNHVEQFYYIIFGFLLLFRKTHIVVHISTFAIYLVKLFAKVMQDKFTARTRGFGVSYNILQERLSYFLLGYRFAYHKLFQFLYIFIRVESQAMPFTTITTSTSCFLIVTFNTFWDIVVDYKTYIGFIDTHTKGDGCYHHINLFHQEHILVFGACFGI